MTADQEARAKDIINRQVSMSGRTLDALRNAGLTDVMAVQIEFFYIAPSETAGLGLIAHLKENDCVDLLLQKSGGLFSRKFSVTGKTHPTQITTAVLAQWLPWMVVQGITRNCEFDGWGAEV